MSDTLNKESTTDTNQIINTNRGESETDEKQLNRTANTNQTSEIKTLNKEPTLKDPLDCEEFEKELDKLELLLKKRDEFIYHVCSYTANIIIDNEKILYKKIPETKKEVLKKIDIKKAVSKLLQDTFNKLFQQLIDKKNVIDPKFTQLVQYFNHSKLGLLYLLAPTCADIHLKFNREELKVEDEKSYIQSVSLLINNELNKEYDNIMTKFIKDIDNERWTNDILNNEELCKNKTPFNFQLEITK
jgi:hypothetical protein